MSLAPAPREGHVQDRDLLARVAEGDRVAFEALFHRFRAPLVRFVSRITQRDELIEEIVNDTMVVVWQKAAQFRGDSRPSTWILGIAYRTALKSARAATRRREQELPEHLTLVDERYQPERDVLLREQREAVRAALTRLSPRHRAVIELTFYNELSYREIATIVDCPENTVKTRMFHARKKLEQLLRRDQNRTLRGSP